jgi:hypothetical protein
MDTWGTSKFRVLDLEKVIAVVHICGYKNQGNEGDLGGRPPTNHWAAFLEVHGGGSVRFDMVPGDGSDGLTGMVIIESKRYKVTDNATKTVSFAAHGRPTVNTVTSLISRLGRDKFKFTENEEGCRYWIYTLISDLEDADIVATGCKGEAWASLSKYWRDPPGSGSQPRSIDQGTFL